MSTLVESPAPHIRYAGDSALLLDVAAMSSSPATLLDAAVNARAIAIAAAVRRDAIPGVRDVLATFRSVAVHFDPLVTDVAAVVASLQEAVRTQTGVKVERETAAGVGSSWPIEIPVAYGGEDGPDLADVAAFAGCSADEVIARHTGRPYRVFMLGFLPGFPYMATVDDTIAAPRRPTPRARVARGSVGIAGLQTGIYPQESPGGWQIIGRTAIDLFDPTREKPALFAAGDEVRFVAIGSHVGAGFSRPETGRLKAAPTTRAVTIIRPGLLTTIQDTGRWGHQALGVPVSGPMDSVSHRVANAAVGNPADAATLEATLAGPELRLEQPAVVAIAGADLGATADERPVPLGAPIACGAGSILRFGSRRTGTRAYIAFAGGLETTPVLGSRATHLLSGLGGVAGRALRAGDCLALGVDLKAGPYKRATRADLPVGADLEVGPTPGVTRLRIMPGPQVDRFPQSAVDLLQRTRFFISPRSDRMGYRLTGGEPIPAADTGDMVSDATFMGAVQVPPSGEPILLMADRQTTGGYPQIAVVVTADLPLAGQLAPGDAVEFELCTRRDAIAALLAQEGRLLAVR